MGDSAAVDFRSGQAEPYKFTIQPKYQMFITNASICDAEGNLLFFSNGVMVGNSKFEKMQNGDSLSPGTFTGMYTGIGMPMIQGAIIIPFPDDTSKYYLFHMNLDYVIPQGGHLIPMTLYYSVIDMRLDGGLGAVIEKNKVLLNTQFVERLTAVKHGNGRDWWLIAHQYDTDRFYRFLITPLGIEGPFYQSIGSKIGYLADWVGQMIFSQDGNKLVNILRIVPGDTLKWEGSIDLFDFDRCTGELSNSKNWNLIDSFGIYGCSFSPSGQYLYVSNPYRLYQYDLWANDIINSLAFIAAWDSSYDPVPPFETTFFTHQLGPDGKIYVSTGQSTSYLHVITSPNEADTNCAFKQKDFYFGHPWKNSVGSVPNYPNYLLEELDGSDCDSLTFITEVKTTKFNFGFYPNPFNDYSIIDLSSIFDEYKNLDLVVYDLLGREVFSQRGIHNPIITIRKDDIPKGLYVYHVFSEDGLITRGKLVVQ